jgi:hypothetical protein
MKVENLAASPKNSKRIKPDQTNYFLITRGHAPLPESNRIIQSDY